MAVKNPLTIIPKDPYKVKFYYDGISKFFPDVFYGSEKGKTMPSSDLWKSPFGNYNRSKFNLELMESTYTNSVDEAFGVVKTWKNYYDKNKAYPDQTLPGEINLEEQVEKLEEKKASEIKQPERQSQEVKKWIEKTAESQIQQSSEIEPPSSSDSEKEYSVLYINTKEKSEQNVLSSDEVKRLKSLVKSAHTDPRTLSENLKKIIIERAPEHIKANMRPEQLDKTAELIAYDLTSKLMVINSDTIGVLQIKPIEVFNAFTNPESEGLRNIISDSSTRREIAKAAQKTALLYEQDSKLTESLTAPVVGNFSNYFYGSDNTREFDEISTERKSDTDTSFSTKDLVEYWKKSSSLENEITNSLKTKNPDLYESLTKQELEEFIRSSPWTRKTSSWSAKMVSQRSFYDGISPKDNAAAKRITTLRTSSLINHWVSNNIPILADGAAGYIPAVAGATIATSISTGPMKYGLTMPLFDNESRLFDGMINIAPEITQQIVKNQLSKSPIYIGKISVGNISKFGLQINTKTGLKTVTGPLIDKFGSMFFGKAAAKTAAKAATKTATTTIARTGIRGVFAAVGTAVSALSGFVLTAAVFIAEKIIEKVVSKAIIWIQRHKKETAAAVAAVLVIGGLVIGAPILIAGGLAVGLGALVIGAGGLAPAAAAAGAFGSSILVGTTSVLVSSIAIPFAVALISFPIIVAFIFFIINAGAYVVPPPSITIQSLYAGKVENPYIGVEKTANPSGPFENSALDQEVEYTITITAKKGRLTNIQLDESCTVTKEGTPPRCPDTDPEIPDTSGLEILPGSPYVFKYKRIFTKPVFEDTAVTDIMTVTADSPDQQNVSDSSSVTIIIGNPPVDCPSGWPIPLPQHGLSTLTITQGPDGTYSHSFYGGLEAIDIGTSRIEGFRINATHRGIVVNVVDGTGDFGKYVDVQSICDDGPFVSRYAHLQVISVGVNQTIEFGDQVGLSGNTGKSSGPHLHYGFRGEGGYGRRGPYPNNIPYMHPIYIPDEVPYGCPENCGTIN